MIELKDICINSGETKLYNISLKAEEKGIYGILCEDSAVKSRLADIICGVENADGGQVLVNAVEMSRKALDLKRKARLASPRLLCDGMSTPVEYLDFIGNVLKIEPEKKYRQIKEAMELVGISDVQNKPIASLPSAAGARLSLAAALIGNPEVIVLDELFEEISDNEARELYEILDMLAEIKILILLSHSPEQVRRLCRHIAIIAGGKIALSGNCEDIEKKINSTHTLNITARGEKEKILEAINQTEGVVSVKILSADKNMVHTLSVEYLPDLKMKDKIFSALALVNVPMLSFKEKKLSLSDVYYSLTIAEEKGNTNNDSSI